MIPRRDDYFVTTVFATETTVRLLGRELETRACGEASIEQSHDALRLYEVLGAAVER